MIEKCACFSILTLLIFVLLPGSLCSADDDVAAEISALLAKQDEAWNRGDISGFMSYYDNTGLLVYIGGSGAMRDRSTLQERYERKYKSGESDFGKLRFTDLRVEELAPGLARAWGKWHLEQKEKEPVSGWFSLLLKRMPEGWRIIHDHSS